MYFKNRPQYMLRYLPQIEVEEQAEGKQGREEGVETDAVDLERQYKLFTIIRSAEVYCWLKACRKYRGRLSSQFW